jgi:hypothetical protein
MKCLKMPSGFPGGIFDVAPFQFSPGVVPVLVPPSVELRLVRSYTEYRYAVVNDRRVIVRSSRSSINRIID